MPTSPPNSDLNAESFFVSDQLKERFDESCAEKKPRKVDLTANDEAQFSLGDSTYAYDITAWSDYSATLEVPVLHLHHFANPLPPDAYLTLFGAAKNCKSTSAIKKDGAWQVTVVFRDI